MILDKIVDHKREELVQRLQAVPLADLQAQAAEQEAPRDFAAALALPGVSLIAEVKRASPSRGLLCRDFDAERLAATYAAQGASAVSVLTDTRFFQGTLSHLAVIRRTLETPIPLLRKDFILDDYQIFEARAHGADAVLLIVAILPNDTLSRLVDLTHELGMTALIEVHDEAEMARALALSPHVVGINSRNLNDFSVDLATFQRLQGLLPDRILAIAESGIHTANDMRRLAAAGADAALVGEALVTAPDVAAKVRELVKGGQP
jgi:indole-3-glycerol phosphate synthase